MYDDLQRKLQLSYIIVYYIRTNWCDVIDTAYMSCIPRVASRVY